MTFEQWWENIGILIFQSIDGEVDSSEVKSIAEDAWVAAVASVEED